MADFLGDGNGTATVGELSDALQFTSLGEIAVVPDDVPIQLEPIPAAPATDS